ncbi:MAG: hypothetical protein HZC40_19015 [Chloroflexi bacterium]|nr:hypothetical protein [Chloroflexota bacterium]
MKNIWARRGLLILGTGLILFLVFGAGFFVGRWSAQPEGRAIFSRLSPSGHSAIGMIQAIDGQTITLAPREGATQIVLITTDTLIERAPKRKKIALADLQVGDRVAVIGAPNAQGQLVARIVSHLVQPTRVPGESN